MRFFEVLRRTGFDWATVQARVVIASFPRRLLQGKGFVLYLPPWFGFLRGFCGVGGGKTRMWTRVGTRPCHTKSNIKL